MISFDIYAFDLALYSCSSRAVGKILFGGMFPFIIFSWLFMEQVRTCLNKLFAYGKLVILFFKKIFFKYIVQI